MQQYQQPPEVGWKPSADKPSSQANPRGPYAANEAAVQNKEAHGSRHQSSSPR